jgi:hypothetical protein
MEQHLCTSPLMQKAMTSYTVSGELGMSSRLLFASGQANLTASPLLKVREADPASLGMWKGDIPLRYRCWRISGVSTLILDMGTLQPATLPL